MRTPTPTNDCASNEASCPVPPPQDIQLYDELSLRREFARNEQYHNEDEAARWRRVADACDAAICSLDAPAQAPACR